MGRLIDRTYSFLANRTPRALGTFTEQAPYELTSEQRLKWRQAVELYKKSLRKRLQPVKDAYLQERDKP